ncbi:DEAD/DEAH box helicase [Segatella hominis]|uniref:DEAD/DEAH box helicase n=2 Tax=Segatella hominis TaxID=2518605 RepID=UPI003AAA38E5
MKNFKLFDYQEDMKERIEKALRLHRSVMAQMPTGTGKTILLASVVESFLRDVPSKTVWIVAHRRELVSQIKDTLNKFLLNFNFFESPRPSFQRGLHLSLKPSLLRREGCNRSYPSL